LTGGWSWYSRAKARLTGSKREIIKEVEELLKPAEIRLRKSLDVVQNNACRSVKDGEMLVFGHTHSAFINKKGNVANTGCWVSASTSTNTYVEIKDGEFRLFTFPGKEIEERIVC
jgi:predicted phosphodiesterase